jgi:amidase
MALDQEGVGSEDWDLPTISVYELWQHQKRKRDLRQQYLDLWAATESLTGTGRPVDAIICPVAPYAAPLHGRNTYVLFYALRTPQEDKI